VLTVQLEDASSPLAVMHQETSKLQALTHPNIVRVIDFDRDGQTAFMTMEYLDGERLRVKPEKDTVKPNYSRAQAMRIIEGMVRALEYAHGKGILHGDLKPGNVMVLPDGEAKVIDFGIARFLRRPGDKARKKEEWHGKFSALTPPYASPEMHDGLEPDTRDDVYALACMAYELLVGEHPYKRQAANQARDAKLAVPKSRRLQDHEHRALTRALHFDRRQRTPGARQFLEELQSGPSEAPRTRGRVWAGLGIGVAALALAFAGFKMLRGGADAPAVIPAGAAAPVEIAPKGPLAAGHLFRDCPTCPLMMVLPPGEFEQGTAALAGALSYEQPAHTVSIPAAMAVGVNEITVGEFAEFAKEYPRDRSGYTAYNGEWSRRDDLNWRNAIAGQNASFPVTCVNWQDAADYAAWLSLRTGSTYRLPSASEWEYLARGGATTLPWAAGSEPCASANVADASAARQYAGWNAFSCSDGFVQAAPVSTFAPNGFGLSDTLGNVFEWTQDCWRDDYTHAPVDGSAVLEGNCQEREARGGSWFTRPEYVRPAYRNRFDAGYRSNSLGFRLIREIHNEV
jgi:formylglycine-generating enzyme required for sulfatase activity